MEISKYHYILPLFFFSAKYHISSCLRYINVEASSPSHRARKLDIKIGGGNAAGMVAVLAVGTSPAGGIFTRGYGVMAVGVIAW